MASVAAGRAAQVLRWNLHTVVIVHCGVSKVRLAVLRIAARAKRLCGVMPRDVLTWIDWDVLRDGTG